MLPKKLMVVSVIRVPVSTLEEGGAVIKRMIRMLDELSDGGLPGRLHCEMSGPAEAITSSSPSPQHPRPVDPKAN